jgi:hypothetical protein
LDPPEHVDSEKIKLKIGSRCLHDQLFSICDFLNFGSTKTNPGQSPKQKQKNVAKIGKN